MKWSSGSCRPAVGRHVQTSAVGCVRQSGVVGCARQSGAAAWRGGAEAWRVGAEAWQSGRGSRALWSGRAFGCTRQSGAAAWRGGAEAWRGGGGGGALWSGRDFGCSPYTPGLTCLCTGSEYSSLGIPPVQGEGYRGEANRITSKMTKTMTRPLPPLT